MKIISIVGERGSGKTSMAIDLANELAAKGFEVRVIFEGPERYARSMASLLHYGAMAVTETSLRSNRAYDYLIYDGYFHPHSSEKYDLSPIITEETYKIPIEL